MGHIAALLDHCLKWYTGHSPEKNKGAVWNGNGRGSGKPQWRLTIGEKKRILSTHIYGVDIDAQAVEVSKLSACSRCWRVKPTSPSSSSNSGNYSRDRALPNLADNIKCGNSDIGPDYFTGRLIADPLEIKRVNAFDWRQGFPDAMAAGGFDCVIGNPPYLFITEVPERDRPVLSGRVQHGCLSVRSVWGFRRAGADAPAAAQRAAWLHHPTHPAEQRFLSGPAVTAGGQGTPVPNRGLGTGRVPRRKE